MYRIFVRISVLIFLNLFAFILIWTILGEVFWSKGVFLIWSVIVSIIPLVVIMFFEVKKVNNKFNNILKEKKYDWDTK